VSSILTRPRAGALGLLVALLAAAALASAGPADAAVCSHGGVTHIGSGNRTINVIACRADGHNAVFQREYGRLFIGSRATRATACQYRLYTEFLTDDDKRGNTVNASRARSCTHILRKSRTQTFFGLEWPEFRELSSMRTVMVMSLRVGGRWAPPIVARSNWQPT
jgi:hypothetical protein